MKRLTILSLLLVAATCLTTGCKSDKKSAMAAVPPPAPSGPAITASNPSVYNAGVKPVDITPIDTTLVPTLTDAQQDVEIIPLNTGIAGNNYTVRQGDTLWRIASSKYGNGQKWRDIVAANPGLVPQTMRVGQTIVLP